MRARNGLGPNTTGRVMTDREHLPARRPSLVFDLELNGLRFTAGYSCFPDNRVGEIFLQNHKPGSQSDSNARDAAVAASLALQFGCPLQTLQHAVLRELQRSAVNTIGRRY